MTRLVVAVVVGALVAGAAVPGTSAGDSPPLADAGLDRQVVVGETVPLDGSGSRDPDGRIESVAWRIETPNGSTRTPACADCRRTWFAPAEPGVYRVTLTVTDGTGTRRTDQLRVVVGTNTRPRVTVDGPSRVRPGEEATYTATVAGGNPLQRVVWTADGEEFARSRLDGNGTTAASAVFESTRRVTVRAAVADVDGDVGTDSVETSVSGAGSGRDEGGGWQPPSGSAWDGGWTSDADGSGDGTGGADDSQSTDEPDDGPGSLDISQPAQRGRYVDPEPDPEPDTDSGSSGGLLETLGAAARLAADAMLA